MLVVYAEDDALLLRLLPLALLACRVCVVVSSLVLAGRLEGDEVGAARSKETDGRWLGRVPVVLVDVDFVITAASG